MSAHDGDCVAPCQLNCPARTDCQGYVGLIANGEFDAALKLIKNKISLPASIGRVCPHPCESACRRKNVEEPINIAQLKAFAADVDLNSNKYIPEKKAATGKRIAVIGGGPAGLTAAYQLAIKGHDVTIYDMMEKMGGMLRYGIPQYRLPKEVLDSEIEIIEKLGVKMINGKKLGKDFTIAQLKAENDAVIVAVGAWKSSSMRTPGEDLDGVYGGIDFLRSVIKGEPVEIGDNVVICGGGNTAMDACRTAVRLGAKNVYVVYRRTRNEMPADRLEIDELGLDRNDRRMLEAIIRFYNGGPVGLETLAAAIGEEAVTIEDVYEPYLLQIGFLSRTPRGRCVSPAGYKHLGFEQDGQQTLL